MVSEDKPITHSNKKPRIKLCVSAFGWTINEEESVKKLLLDEKVDGIEIIPDRIMNNLSQFEPNLISSYRNFWERCGIKIASFQGILFTRNDLRIFESEQKRDEALKYLERIVEIGKDLGANNIMFGAGKNRQKGILSIQEAESIAIPFFKKISDYSKEFGLNFSLEALTSEYGADYIMTTSEAVDLAVKINHSSFGITVDTGTIISNKEDAKVIENCSNYLKHFHISLPSLAPISNIDISQHSEFRYALLAIDYQGYVSIEMKKSDGNNIDNLKKAIDAVRKAYY